MYMRLNKENDEYIQRKEKELHNARKEYKGLDPIFGLEEEEKDRLFNILSEDISSPADELELNWLLQRDGNGTEWDKSNSDFT